MNAKITGIACALIFSAVFFSVNSFAKDMGYYPMAPASSEARSLIGKQVDDQTGGYLGKISDFVIDEANNRVALVVVSSVPGFGSDQIAFPFKCLKTSGPETYSIFLTDVSTFGEGVGQESDLQILKQYPADSPLYSIPEPTNPNLVAEVYRSYGYLPYWVQKGEKAPSASGFTDLTTMIGARVRASEANEYATVNDMVIGPSGYLDLLVLSDVTGRGTHRVAVPYETLKKDMDGTLVLNIAKDRLAMAPVFNKVDLYHSGYDARVDRFFGLSPRWINKQQQENNPYRWGGEAQGF